MRAGWLERGAARSGAERDDRRVGGRMSVLRPAPVRGRVLAASRGLELCRVGAAWQFVPEAAGGAAVLHRKYRAPSRTSPEPTDSQLQPAASPRREPRLSRHPDPDAVGRASDAAAQALRRGARPPGRLLRRQALTVS